MIILFDSPEDLSLSFVSTLVDKCFSRVSSERFSVQVKIKTEEGKFYSLGPSIKILGPPLSFVFPISNAVYSYYLRLIESYEFSSRITQLSFHLDKADD